MDLIIAGNFDAKYCILSASMCMCSCGFCPLQCNLLLNLNCMFLSRTGSLPALGSWDMKHARSLRKASAGGLTYLFCNAMYDHVSVR